MSKVVENKCSSVNSGSVRTRHAGNGTREAAFDEQARGGRRAVDQRQKEPGEEGQYQT